MQRRVTGELGGRWTTRAARLVSVRRTRNVLVLRFRQYHSLDDLTGIFSVIQVG